MSRALTGARSPDFFTSPLEGEVAGDASSPAGGGWAATEGSPPTRLARLCERGDLPLKGGGQKARVVLLTLFVVCASGPASADELRLDAKALSARSVTRDTRLSADG